LHPDDSTKQLHAKVVTKLVRSRNAFCAPNRLQMASQACAGNA